MSDDLIERMKSWKHTPGGIPEQRKLIADVPEAADTLASKDTALAEIRAENERRKEWQDAIIGLCKAIGSDDMPWGGDKAGWGFIFYFVKHLHTRAEAAETELARAASRALSQEER